MACPGHRRNLYLARNGNNARNLSDCLLRASQKEPFRRRVGLDKVNAGSPTLEHLGERNES
jgi:hypothetical protein